MKHTLVTGGAGYIGSHVVKALVREGYQPVIYDNLHSGHRKAVSNIPLIEGDLSDQKKLTETFKSYPIRAVMHFAANCSVEESVKNPLKYFKNNVTNSLNLIETMYASGVKKIVFSSSAAVYGEPREIPITEAHPCLPTNPYGDTKYIFEKILQTCHHTGMLSYIALRYFNAAGSDPEGKLGEDHSPETHLIPLTIQVALNKTVIRVFGTDYPTPDGTCIRDYIHVNDLAQAHLLALKKLDQEDISAVYNLGNGNGYSVKEVIETVKKVTGKELKIEQSPRRSGDPARLIASSEKIRKELGWTPKYPDLETIVDTAYQWYKNHPKGYEDKA